MSQDVKEESKISPEADLHSYDYDLPKELIAQRPVTPRDSSRLLVLDRERGTWEHRHFSDLPEYLGEKDFLVANNTRVIKARLLGHRLNAVKPESPGHESKNPGGKVEFVLLEELRPRVWEGLFHASARYVPGLRFEIPTPDGRGLRGVLIKGVAESPHGTVVAEFDRDPLGSGAGEIPLPHYIVRNIGRNSTTGGALEDEQSYQTLFAREPGSAAAPTAGLHFTESVMEKLRARHVGWAEVTLHVGLGTFRPVKTRDITAHRMHEERYWISTEVARAVNEAKASSRRIVGVGTTSVRTLESAWREGEGVVEGEGRTSLFIRPGAYEFRVVDCMITNFHLPQSTLLMLVCAFAGREFVMAAYREAVREKYRFFSYGDAMLVL